MSGHRTFSSRYRTAGCRQRVFRDFRTRQAYIKVMRGRVQPVSSSPGSRTVAVPALRENPAGPSSFRIPPFLSPRPPHARPVGRLPPGRSAHLRSRASVGRHSPVRKWRRPHCLRPNWRAPNSRGRASGNQGAAKSTSRPRDRATNDRPRILSAPYDNASPLS